MRLVENSNYTCRECKYYAVFIPKYRKKLIFGRIRSELGNVFRRLGRQKEVTVHSTE